jgi:hypothetical protein
MALTPEQQSESERIKRELQVVFQKYDRNRDGHLTMEEYNQWQIDSGKVQRVFTTQIRFDRFCRSIYTRIPNSLDASSTGALENHVHHVPWSG